jgi:hypothetical protein
MPKGLPTFTFDEVNQSQVPPIQLEGVHGVIASSLFGQADKPYEITSVQQFLNEFGGAGTAAPYFAQIRRALARGVTIWFQRLLFTGATAAHIALDVSDITVTAHDLGAWANGTVGIQYTPLAVGVGGVPGTNQFVFTYSGNANLNEVWQSNSLNSLIALVNANSEIVSLSTSAGYVEPANTTGTPVMLANGVDGAFASIAAADAAVAALMPNFDDSALMPIDTLSAFGGHSLAHYTNLNLYVSARKDIMGLFEIDPTLAPAAAATFATTLQVDLSEFMAVYYSSLVTAYSPEQATSVSGPCLGDVIAVWAVSDTMNGNVYLAPAGSRRGLIPNITSFAYNLLSPSLQSAANALVALGVNIVGNDPTYGPVVWGAQTMAQSNTALDAINVRRILTSLNQQVTPIFRSEQFQPMNPVTWRDAYTKVLIVLNQMVSDGAIYAGFTYVGDQEASTISDATYNDPVDLANGLYKVLISVVPVGYIYNINCTLDVNNLITLFNTTTTVSSS